MRKITLALLLFALAGGAVAPTAAAEEFQANVVSWSPNAVQPGKPVSVVLLLSTPGPSLSLTDRQPIAGVGDVEVVIHGEVQTRRFATEDLGRGRYGTEIVFPEAGGWDLRVRSGAASDGSGDEVLLGKGAICVGGELCAGESATQSMRAEGDGRPWAARVLAVGGVLIVALVAAAAIRFGAFGRRPKPQRRPRAAA